MFYINFLCLIIACLWTVLGSLLVVAMFTIALTQGNTLAAALGMLLVMCIIATGRILQHFFNAVMR